MDTVQNPKFTKNAADVLHTCRAKYVPDLVSGGWRLANICSMPRPVFHTEGWEAADEWGEEYDPDRDTRCCTPEENQARSIRRAKENAFDLVLCNDFSHFSTLTFSPEHVDRSDWSSVYEKVRVFFGNLVQRYGFRYLCVPEHHHDGEAIHFHLLSNSSGLKLVNSGHRRHGKAVYNIDNWRWGFSTSVEISGEDCRDKCAKYIFKYMGKQMSDGGAKIGGRYYLSGGDLVRPRYVLGDSPEELGDLTAATYERSCYTIIGLFRSWSFI